MIYGRFGDEVKIKRVAVLADVQRLEGRKPDAQDRKAIADNAYVVAETAGAERLYHLSYLRADDGINEIFSAIDATKVHATSKDSA